MPPTAFMPYVEDKTGCVGVCFLVIRDGKWLETEASVMCIGKRGIREVYVN